jgi:SpoIID/LytB domain protein
MGSSRLERDDRMLPVLAWARMRVIASTYHRVRARPDGRRRPYELMPVTLPTVRWATLTTIVALALGAAPAGASTLLIEGAGDGHGVGMSQDGAYGYAEHGWSDGAILAHYYTGTTIGQAPSGSVVKVLEGAKVVKVPLERYVRGVVSAEMPSSWPMAALEAQAIASRTYALTDDAGGSRFDVYSDTRSQMYVGAAAETAQTNAAVAATAGQIVLYGGQPAITYYFASSGGMTENNENSFLDSQPEPWLRGVPDAYETKSSSWKLSMSFASVAARLKGLVRGSFRGIEVLRRGVSPRILAAQVLGSRGNTSVSGPELEARLGLDSAWAYFSVKNGRSVTPEPDLSGQAPFAPPAPESPPPAPAPAPSTGPQGGAQAPGTVASAATTGGVQAG